MVSLGFETGNIVHVRYRQLWSHFDPGSLFFLPGPLCLSRQASTLTESEPESIDKSALNTVAIWGQTEISRWKSNDVGWGPDGCFLILVSSFKIAKLSQCF